MGFMHRKQISGFHFLIYILDYKNGVAFTILSSYPGDSSCYHVPVPFMFDFVKYLLIAKRTYSLF